MYAQNMVGFAHLLFTDVCTYVCIYIHAYICVSMCQRTKTWTISALHTKPTLDFQVLRFARSEFVVYLRTYICMYISIATASTFSPLWCAFFSSKRKRVFHPTNKPSGENDCTEHCGERKSKRLSGEKSAKPLTQGAANRLLLPQFALKKPKIPAFAHRNHKTHTALRLYLFLSKLCHPQLKSNCTFTACEHKKRVKKNP
ncbi:unnamed protein product [Ceratitis capitata]|uniref:(Mediterranean fruit fly) hypothetical protein n=1 Tax=Ceratitis capitata TaxID=7213 RepID=A0A811VE40_CERCA|nr:unnamed protein product [Ceratitis capitata]